jgi:hypothetical protein
MAVIKLKPNVQPRLGAPGGTVFSLNSSGLIAIRRRKPLYKLNPKTSLLRSKFRHVQGQWRLLTAQNKNTFSANKQDYARIDPVGNVIVPSASQLHTKLNQPLAVSDFQLSSNAYPAYNFPTRSFGPWFFRLFPFTLLLGLSNPLIPPGLALKIWSGPIDPSNKSRSFPHDFKLLKTTTTTTVPFYDITSDYKNAYGPPPEPDPNQILTYYLSCAIQLIRLEDGQQALVDQNSFKFIE